MAREEQIKDAAIEIIKKIPDDVNIDIKAMAMAAFHDGVKWADEHPNTASIWHNTKDKLPCEQGHIEHDVMFQDNVDSTFIGWFDYDTDYFANFASDEVVLGVYEVKRWCYMKDVFARIGN